MYHFVMNVFLWSFFIYGIIDFMQEVWLDILYYIAKILKYFVNFGKYVKKILIKDWWKYIIKISEWRRRGVIVGNKRANR